MEKHITRINKEWHKNNRMPKKPSSRRRIKWHLAHAKQCACRPISEKLKTEIKSESKKNRGLIL